MTSSEAPSDVSSLFAKKKGKKGKKGPKAYNLNLDSGITKPEETPKMTAMNEILGGTDPSEDDGWAEVVEKKSVVATGGKQVSELIDMTSLMTEDESTASKLEKQDIKQAFHDARMLKEEKEEPAPDSSKDESKADEASRGKGLSGNIFGGSAARGGWQARMQERELKQREQELSVDNSTAFPSLRDAMSGPPKPKTSGAAEGNPWIRRGGGGSAAAAAIKAALAGGIDGASDGASGTAASGPSEKAKAKAKPKPKMAEPVWVAPRVVKSSGSNPTEPVAEAPEATAEEDPVPKVNGRSALQGKVQEDRAREEEEKAREEEEKAKAKAREEADKAREKEEKAREKEEKAREKEEKAREKEEKAREKEEKAREKEEKAREKEEKAREKEEKAREKEEKAKAKAREEADKAREEADKAREEEERRARQEAEKAKQEAERAREAEAKAKEATAQEPASGDMGKGSAPTEPMLADKEALVQRFGKKKKKKKTTGED